MTIIKNKSIHFSGLLRSKTRIGPGARIVTSSDEIICLL